MDNNKKSISVVLLALSEQQNLEEILPKINSKMQTLGAAYEIIVIDGKETKDNSPEVCQSNGAKYYNQKLSGFAGAYAEGINRAQNELILTLDCDGSHDVEEISKLYQKAREGFQLVIGSRYIKGGTNGDKRTSIFLSKILNFIFRVITGFKAKELSTNFRIYTTTMLKNMPLKSKNFEVMQELLLRLKKENKNLRYIEVPITFKKRVYGQSKRKYFKFIITYFLNIFRLAKLRMFYDQKSRIK